MDGFDPYLEGLCYLGVMCMLHEMEIWRWPYHDVTMKLIGLWIVHTKIDFIERRKLILF